jgi:hypothetical protein
VQASDLAFLKEKLDVRERARDTFAMRWLDERLQLLDILSRCLPISLKFLEQKM